MRNGRAVCRLHVAVEAAVWVETRPGAAADGTPDQLVSLRVHSVSAFLTL
jgi:hypothetical protein